VNVTIVGAGIIGYAIAYELAARGVQVRVIDARESGQGATRASAGVLAPHIEGHSPPLLRLGVCSLDLYDSFIARVAEDAQLPIEYRRSGTLQVALNDEEATQLAEDGRSLARASIPHTYCDGAEARQLEAALAPSARAALLVPQHGYVGVATLMSALVEASARRGVEMLLARVHGITCADGAVRIETSEDTSIADAVVIAAGSWSGVVSAPPARPVPVRPVRGQLLQLRLVERRLSRVIWGTSGYAVPWQDGSVLIGATVEEVGFDERVTAAGVRQLLETGINLVPSLHSAEFEGARAGLRPATPDELPIVGASSTMPRVYYATGHYRNGVLLAPLTAAMFVDLLVHGREHPQLELVRPIRFGL
jgi:glycine oxidase